MRQGGNMKKTTLTPIAMIAIMALAMTSLVSAATQLWSAPLNVKVPFAFSVSGKAMPAGEYTLSEQGPRGVIVVRNFAEKKAVGVLTQLTRSENTSKQSRLEFRRYGSQYFLASVRIAGQDTSIEMLRSKAERRAADELKNIAGVQAQPELVIVNVLAAE
jgi:hypothetical protein